MNHLKKLSFVARILIAMALSLVLNALVGHHLKLALSGGTYALEVETIYPIKGTMQLFYDTGSDFNPAQQVGTNVEKGLNTLYFPFMLKGTEHLKHIRLDFGSDLALKEVAVRSVVLLNNGKVLFHLKKEQLDKHLGLLVCISDVDKTSATFKLDTIKSPFDPYVVFDPLNELIYTKWQRTLLLVLPWFLLFFVPLMNWIKAIMAGKHYELLLIGCFLSAIPLKIAWVTFTTLLLLGYSLIEFYQKRQLKLGPIQISLVAFFAVPLLFVGDGQFSKLAIPLGFVIFALIGTLVDFSDRNMEIKKIYTMVYFIIMSIIIVNWLVLIGYNGYYYNAGFATYFIDIKSTVHLVNDWLYYPHTTFLSFFILIGTIFCYDCFRQNGISKIYLYTYLLFCIITLMLLGSRFSLMLLILLPFLFALPLKSLGRLAVPTWAALFFLLVYFMDIFDSERLQLWKMSWQAFKDKIWTGHGTGTSEVILQNLELARKTGFDSILERNHSHNQYLTYLLENGILGTLLFLTAYLFMGYNYIKQGNKTMLLVALMVALLLLIESPFRTTTSLYMIAFLFSVFSSPKSISNTKGKG